MIDYTTLKLIWWLLLGLLLIGFAVMDGFDLGVGMLLHRVARTNEERRIMINTIGPVWEGNQIWLILGAGAIFAAWPTIYAVTFSGFYFAMLMVLLGLIIRPVGFKYRSKIDNTAWRTMWDIGLFIGSFVPALIFGVAIGNILQGVPFHFDDSLRSFYTGSLLDLLNPFALCCGLLSVVMLVMHGSCYLCIKTEGIIQQKSHIYTYWGAIFTILLFALAGLWIAFYISGYVITSTISTDAPANPLYKQVSLQTGAWLANYYAYPLNIFIPACGFLGALFAMLFTRLNYYKSAWTASALSIAGIIGAVGISMFPFMLPSSSMPNVSLLIWDASSSQMTLFIMLIATIIFLPIIVMYTSWVYYVLRGKITHTEVQQNNSTFY